MIEHEFVRAWGWLFALVFVGTLIWALFDAGFDFWPLVSRLMVPAGLMLLAATFGLNLIAQRVLRKK